MLITGGLFTSGVRLQQYVASAAAQIASDWHFNATSETNWAGVSLINSPTLRQGKYLEFTGSQALSTDYIATNTLTNDDYTYEFWLRTAPGNGGALLTKQGVGGYTVSAIELNTTNSMIVGYWTEPQAYQAVPTAITRDVWQHYTVTYNTVTGYLKTYFNGSLVDTTTLAPEVSPRDYGSYSQMYFDMFTPSVTNFGNGGALTADFGEFRLYTRALSDAEVLGNYQATEARWRPTGLYSSDASTSAYQIKQDWPASTDGLYWIQNANINSGNPVQIYADMTTGGGGWTLIMQNNNADWNFSNALLRNQTSPPATLADGGHPVPSNYSIIGWADYIKRSASGFDYMLEAGVRNQNGGMWTANEAYSFVDQTNTNTENFGTDPVAGSNGFHQNVTEIAKFGNWNYTTEGIEHRMPWYCNDPTNPGNSNVPDAIFTTSHNDGGAAWWGTLMAVGASFQPAPWHYPTGLANPGIIWYWVR